MDAAGLEQFAESHAVAGLSAPSVAALAEGRAGYSLERARQFLRFQERVRRELLQHRIIVQNAYTSWFRRGEQNAAQVRAFIVQFSVFSNRFLIAQLHKMLNADTLEGMRSSKEILANEIGVVFRSGRKPAAGGGDPEREGDPELVSIEGTVDGGIFHFRAAHFEWLLRLAEKAGLRFDEVGKRVHGTAPTLHFCDELQRLYAHEDYQVATAASWAVENWAAAGFWDELVEGWKRYGERVQGQPFDMGFFTWHARIEANHAQHTQDELAQILTDHYIDEDRFVQNANLMLDAVLVFWRGLDFQRAALAADADMDVRGRATQGAVAEGAINAKAG